ncbi:MAG: T9SS type A sorting domain-containing protein [Bacteroidetes bacterium]|nr:T9SS type A sorting domain-containing protein [Bacteroidota bacterium]
MKKFIIFIFIIVTQNIFGQWITSNDRYSTFSQDSISNVYWRDSSTIFASGRNNMIIKSENGGANWSYSNSGINQTTNSKDINNLKFFNSNTGFASSSFLYKTTNGGNNWSVVSSNYYDSYIYVSPNVVYALTHVDASIYFYKSTNGGVNWVQCDTLLPPAYRISFVNDSTGYCSTTNQVFKTTNSGKNWINVWSGISINEFNFQDANKGFILRYNEVLNTTNGGQTWNNVNSTNLYTCLFYKNDTMICSSSLTEAKFCFSSNGGVTFTNNTVVMPYPEYFYKTRCSFWDKNRCVLTGGKRIFKSTDFGSSFTDIGAVSGDYTSMNSIHMFNANEIFIATDVYFWKTTNGGINWGKFNQGLPLSQIKFTNYNNGFGLTPNRVRYTIDHGDTWSSFPVVPGVYGTHNLLRVLNESFIVLGLTYTTTVSPGTRYTTNNIYTTTNSGTNWNLKLSVQGVAGSNGYNSSETINDVFFINSNTGFSIYNKYQTQVQVPSFLAESGKILKTINGGNNWTTILDLDSTQGGKIYFINPTTGYYSVYSHFASSTKKGIYKTTNGGTNWNKITDFYSNNFIFTDENTAFSSNGYASSDGGINWISQFTPYSPNAIQFINNYTGFIVGNEGVIYKTTNAGGLNVGVSQISSEVPDKFALRQNYPNPFNPSTVIRYQLLVAGFTTLKVFDLLGKEVAVLVNEKQNAGSYAVDFNSAEYNLPSGIYFYTLNAGEFKETRKMVLIK